MTPLRVFELFILVSISLLTLIGNCFIILAFMLGSTQLRSVTNYFVVNLALADLLVGCVSLPFWMVTKIDAELVHGSAYPFFIALDIICGTTSILNLTAISVERMIAVKFPAHHFNMGKLPVFLAIAATWSCGFILGGAKFAVGEGASLKWYTGFLFVLTFASPLAVIVFSYSAIFRTARGMMQASNQENGRIQRELSIAKMISVIIGLFIVCWCPFFIVNMIFVFSSEATVATLPLTIIDISKMLHYSNSMMNFFVYGHRSPDFRRAFHQIFKCNLHLVQRRIRLLSQNVASVRFHNKTDQNKNISPFESKTFISEAPLE